jgi:hypothetical protein
LIESGVIGLELFALTIFGLGVLFFIGWIDKKYRFFHAESDYIVASDTDSMFVQALPVINHRNPEIDNNDDKAIIEKVQEIAKEFQSKVNNYYDTLAKESFNSPIRHYLEMKMETVVKAAYWSKKRRYAQYIVNEEGVPVDKLDFKGLELMKSNFPRKFKAFGTNLIKEIMYCNKDVAHCTMGINLDGVMKLAFDNGNTKSEYYLVAKEL